MKKHKEIGYEIGSVSWDGIDGFPELWNKTDISKKDEIVNGTGLVAIKLVRNILVEEMPSEKELEEMAKKYAENEYAEDECSCYTNDFYGFLNGARAILKAIKYEGDRILRYECATCGNQCLLEKRPDEYICGGCEKPDWKLMKLQKSYKVSGEDWVHPDGEI